MLTKVQDTGTLLVIFTYVNILTLHNSEMDKLNGRRRSVGLLLLHEGQNPPLGFCFGIWQIPDVLNKIDRCLAALSACSLLSTTTSTPYDILRNRE